MKNRMTTSVIKREINRDMEVKSYDTKEKIEKDTDKAYMVRILRSTGKINYYCPAFLSEEAVLKYIKRFSKTRPLQKRYLLNEGDKLEIIVLPCRSVSRALDIISNPGYKYVYLPYEER